MATIKNYVTDSSLDAADKWVGTDGKIGAENGKTKNFTLGDVKDYMEDNITSLNIISKNAANDAAAALLNVPVGGLYHTAGVLKIRLT